MKNIFLAFILCSFCSYAQIPTEPSPDENNELEMPEQDITEIPEQDDPEEYPVKLSKRRNNYHIGLMAGAGLTGDNPEKQGEHILNPVIGAAAYYKFTKRSAMGLDLIYYKDILIVPHYRWTYENLYLKVGSYYTIFYEGDVISQYGEYNLEKGFKASIGCQFNQMRWKPFAEFHVFGLNLSRLDSYIFMMTGGVMF